ncbi:hypothetical protein [Methylomicrobium sp. Wu6]|uniref:hypothetical protein n=1 Tax=Methylomicrobium sp. Wu6 TaxID=3107928 RepID=UPI002DD64EB2|nr:hypothetical protein [Methylomicrobium sp. Wu6]MEC4750026.1 hypothetical protein [Methylomicrobium sp. Wu6]
MTDKQTCAVCRYARKPGNIPDSSRQCQRHPPKIMHDPEDFAEFPRVYADDWCGEFQIDAKEA